MISFQMEHLLEKLFMEKNLIHKKYILTKRHESDPDQSISNLNLLLAELKTDN